MSSAVPTIIIKPGKGTVHYWRELWQYRELFYFLAWRDILVRYKQTVIGIAWAIIRPVLTMVVFTIVFGKIANLPTAGSAPYAIMVFAALLPWQFFSSGLTEASNSLITNANMLTKIFFPRLIVPASTIIVCVVDFLITLVILAILMAAYQFAPSWQALFLPLFFLLALLPTLGLGIWVAAVNVKYRDFRYVIPFVVQFGLYITPVGFSSTIVPEKWRLLYSLNPIVGVVDGFRWCLLRGEPALEPASIGISVFISLLILFWGVKYFKKVERNFADVI
ncbi:MAG TPA: ABC transporter permease [bacterium]|nr:ABC transporter permease [bacterium]HOR57139.1 ABC transporter permease [bacterium]HPL56140.1 ABC transporter permease [bacterium]